VIITIILVTRVECCNQNIAGPNLTPVVAAIWIKVIGQSDAGIEPLMEAGKLIKADGRRENIESIEAMRKRGVQVHTLTPALDAEWDQTVAKAYPKVRGIAVPPDIYDEVVSQLKTFRAAHQGVKQ